MYLRRCVVYGTASSDGGHGWLLASALQQLTGSRAGVRRRGQRKGCISGAVYKVVAGRKGLSSATHGQ